MCFTYYLSINLVNKSIYPKENLVKSDFKVKILKSNKVRITWNATNLINRGFETLLFSALTIHPPFTKEYSNFVKVTSGKAKIMKLKASREYIVSVMEEGVENIVNIGSVKTWPSGNFLLVHLSKRCRIDIFIKIFCICIAPDLKWFSGKALSSRELVLKWKEPYLKNGILKPYVVKCANLNGSEYHPANNLSDTSTSALFVNLHPKTVYL